jgi:hypothetical protein
MGITGCRGSARCAHFSSAPGPRRFARLLINCLGLDAQKVSRRNGSQRQVLWTATATCSQLSNPKRYLSARLAQGQKRGGGTPSPATETNPAGRASQCFSRPTGFDVFVNEGEQPHRDGKLLGQVSKIWIIYLVRPWSVAAHASPHDNSPLGVGRNLLARATTVRNRRPLLGLRAPYEAKPRRVSRPGER